MTTRVNPRTYQHLEWSKIQERLGYHCHGPIALERALSLAPTSNSQNLAIRLARTTEARHLMDAGYNLPVHGAADVGPSLSRAERGGVLDPEELIAIGHIIEAAARCAVYLEGLKDNYPHLNRIAETITPLPDIGRQILDSFDHRGELANNASGELHTLRHRVAQMHDQLKELVSGLAANPDYVDMLQDEYYTIREDRYVLPVRSGHKNHIEGIVHGWSGSGATVFIEPQPVVEANNRLIFAHAEVDREIRRILTKLSKRVGAEAQIIRTSMTALAELDFAWATGHLSAELEAHPPIIHHEGSIELKEARHPLLLLAGHPVIPNDLILSAERPILVLTGPNTGGKTVALKTVGLCTLMALSGLHIPASAESKVPVVPSVLSDIGDEQSLEEHLSTFSGHIKSIRNILDSTAPGSLILLDELVVGTDPIQGSALAQAILEAMADAGCIVVVTTHYEGLKVLPFEDNRFRNGAMGFDPETGQPTFLLAFDIPGASSALQTARRLGLSDGIVERAIDLAGPQQQALQAVIESLERERDGMRRSRLEMEAEKNRILLARSALEAKEKKLSERLRVGLDQEQNAALKDARAVRDELKRLKKQLRTKAGPARPEWIDEAQKRTKTIIESIADAQNQRARELAGPAPSEPHLKLGNTVFVVSLGREAELIELPDAKGRCQVRAGMLTIRVEIDDLRPRNYGKTVAAKRASAHVGKRKELPGWDNAPPQTPDNTIDVRGYRTDESIVAVEKFLDGCYGRDGRIAFIVHGHGTGALKTEIRRWLKTSKYVREQRRGNRHEGGDGVTAVLLS